MGDLAFGKRFRMLENEKQHFAVNTLRQGMLALGLFTPVPWLFVILITTPGLMRGWNKMIAWSTEEVDHRIKVCKLLFVSVYNETFDMLNGRSLTERAGSTRRESTAGIQIQTSFSYYADFYLVDRRL